MGTTRDHSVINFLNSEKDLTFYVTTPPPPSNSQTLQQQQQEDHEVDIDLKLNVMTSSLKIKILPQKHADVQEEEEEGSRTPTSPGNKIPKIFTCPPAPIKPKSSVTPLTKRKLISQCRRPERSVFLDLSKEIDRFLFTTTPSSSMIFQDLDGIGGGGSKIKKHRLHQEN
ncbi:hypothetical protein ACFE04_007232 [Oxalis oulophora]